MKKSHQDETLELFDMNAENVQNHLIIAFIMGMTFYGLDQ
jgi:hypothetical protein